MPSTCKFILNKPNAVYYSGESISGQAIVNITFVQDVRSKFNKMSKHSTFLKRNLKKKNPLSNICPFT